MDAYESTHAGFQRDLRGSEPARQAIGELLRKSGQFADVYLKPLSVAPTRGEAHKHRDHGDIIVTLKDGERLRYEVKSTPKHDWTGPGDYPYPNVIVVTKYKHDDAMQDKLPPRVYYIVNKSLTHYAAISVKTQPAWTVRVTSDQDGNHQERYFAAKHLFQWRSMNDGIAKRKHEEWLADYEAEELRQFGRVS